MFGLRIAGEEEHALLPSKEAAEVSEVDAMRLSFARLAKGALR
jgi:hypothetical protein